MTRKHTPLRLRRTKLHGAAPELLRELENLVEAIVHRREPLSVVAAGKAIALARGDEPWPNNAWSKQEFATRLSNASLRF